MDDKRYTCVVSSSSSNKGAATLRLPVVVQNYSAAAKVMEEQALFANSIEEDTLASCDVKDGDGNCELYEDKGDNKGSRESIKMIASLSIASSKLSFPPP
ncbi:hypothetical protein ACH5RR_033725 [Cinchona calisaya]|uniref:Uncharacterized protein n=1 Tax=Cinchona calisaya TaxID=153742 RepID=A0ABD2YCP2_9GENT